jgi:hypothetical protein
MHAADAALEIEQHHTISLHIVRDIFALQGLRT